MIIIVIPQLILEKMCAQLSENWVSGNEMKDLFGSEYVSAFLQQFDELITEGEENGIIYYTLGLGEEESKILGQQILAANQKWLELN